VEAIFKVISEKFPNGIVNDSIGIKRLKKFGEEQGIAISNYDIEQIFDKLIKNNGRYYLREMLINEENEREIEEQVNKWIQEFDFFEIGSLLNKFENAKFSKDFKTYKYLATTEDPKTFRKTLTRIKEIFDENGGEVEQQKFFEQLEHLMPETVKEVLKQGFPNIVAAKDGYFKDSEIIGSNLPKDFKEKLHNAEKRLAELNFTVNQNNLNLLLSLEYGENFCEKYKLQDNKIFNKYRSRLKWRKD
jgi:hypothetical protein